MRALVIHGGGKGLAFAKDLVHSGIETYVLRGRSPAFAAVYPGVRPSPREAFATDAFNPLYPDPIGDPEGYRQHVLAQIELLRPQIVIPVNSEEITALYPAAERLAEIGVVFPFGSHEWYDRLRDKSSMAELFPEYVAESHTYEGYWFKKPCRLTSAEGVARVGSEGPWVLQREFVGHGVGFEALVDEGRIVYGFMHRRKREFPASGGASTARLGIWDEAIAEVAAEIVRRCDWKGFLMIEFRRDEGGDFRLIEINPRPWGSIELPIQSGVRFPSLACRYFVDGEEPTIERVEGIELRIVPYDVAAGFQYLLRGEPAQFRDALAFWRPFRWEIFRPFDPRFWRVNLVFLYDGLKRVLKGVGKSLRRKGAG